ncbi:MAG: PTS sugar transporter subunit IIB [Arachnia sp.]
MRTKILIVCGSGVATSTVVSEKVKEHAKSHGWDVEVSLCRATDVRQTVGTFNPRVVLATTAVPDDLGVPAIPAVGLLTGIGQDAIFAELGEVISRR